MKLFDDQAIARMRLTMMKGPTLARNGWNKFEERMHVIDERSVQETKDEILELRKRFEQYGGNKRFSLGNFVREQAKLAAELAFYYRLSEKKQYAGYAAELLGAICQEPAWVYQYTAPQQSDLWTADIGLNLTIALELIHDEVSEENRIRWSDALFLKAFTPIYAEWLHPVKKLHSLDTMGHNWWSVCVCAAGFILLSLGRERSDYESYLHTIVEGMMEWFAYPGSILQNKHANFGSEGDYLESVGYLDYSLANFSLFEMYYRKLNGDKRLMDIPVLKQIPDMYLSTVYPTKGGYKWINFGDVGMRQNVSYVWLYLAEIFGRNEMVDYYQAMDGVRGNPLDLFFYPEGLTPQGFMNPPQEMVLRQTGYAIIRTGKESEQTMFAIKTGESWNHNHLDVGTFILSAGGTEFISDSGMCSYSKPLYNEYYRASVAHNVILLEGRGQRNEMMEFGSKFMGSIPVHLSSPDYTYVLADCTGPYADVYQRFYRHVLFISGLIVMVDDVFAGEEGTFEWLLHIQGHSRTEGNRIVVSNEGREMTVHTLYPEQKTYVREQGYLHAKKDKPGEEDVFPEGQYWKIHAASPEGDRRIKFITVFEVDRQQEDERPEITRIETGNAHVLGIRIRQGGEVTELYCNLLADGRLMHKNSHVSFGGIETDALLTVVTLADNGQLLRAGVHHGSYLKHDGKSLYSTLLKGDAVLDYAKGLTYNGHAAADFWAYFQHDGSTDPEAIYDPITGMWKKKLCKGNNYFQW